MFKSFSCLNVTDGQCSHETEIAVITEGRSRDNEMFAVVECKIHMWPGKDKLG